MQKGELLGKGKTAEVYEWGEDKVLKLYFEKYDEEWVKREFDTSRKVHEAGIPSPYVYEITELNGRKGIILERIKGRTIHNILQKEPWKLDSLITQLADFHLRLHQRTAEGLPNQKERFEYKIKLSSEILGDRVDRILDYIAVLPDGNSICHGDLYFGNILISNNRLVAIDWNSSYIGNPLGDVARTSLILNSPAVIPGAPDILALMFLYPKWLGFRKYLNEYMRISKAKYEDVDVWLLPVAAARLKDKIPGEEKWLMQIIDKRLKLI